MLVRNLPSTAFHSPFKSGLPSGRRGAGAVRFGLPSAVRGIRGSGCFSHCAGADEAKSARRTHASAAYLLIATPRRKDRRIICRPRHVLSSATDIKLPRPYRKDSCMATKIELPAEAVEAYNLYIHGNIDRRAFMGRINKVAASAVAATAMVDALMPNYAAGQQVSPTDARITTKRETVPSPNGKGSINGLP